MRRPILEAWRQYRQEVLPTNAPAVQVRETRRAFYAGAQGLMSTIMRGLAPDREPTEADLLLMSAVESDLERFGREVGSRAEDEIDRGGAPA